MTVALNVNTNKKLVNVLYIDDEKSDIDNFRMRLDTFMESEPEYDIHLVGVKEYDELMEMISNQSSHTKGYRNFDILMCDQNMPGKWNGLGIIKHLLPNYPNIVYVLFTGVRQPLNDIKKECDKKGILHIIKTEEISTIMLKILNNMPTISRKRNDANDSLYKNICAEIIDDLKNIQQKDPTYRVTIDSSIYKPSELISHLIDRTDIADSYVEDYFNGLKFLKNVRFITKNK